jgi:hypothetical protein
MSRAAAPSFARPWTRERSLPGEWNKTGAGAAKGMVVSFFPKAASATAMSKDERAVVLDEIHELLRAKRLALMPPHHGLTSVFPAGSVAERFGMTVSIEDVSGKRADTVSSLAATPARRERAAIVALARTSERERNPNRRRLRFPAVISSPWMRSRWPIAAMLTWRASVSDLRRLHGARTTTTLIAAAWPEKMPRSGLRPLRQTKRAPTTRRVVQSRRYAEICLCRR